MAAPTIRRFTPLGLLAVACVFASFGCGGGGSSTGGGGGGGGPKSAPTAVTKTNTAAHLAAMGQASLSLAFAGYGSNLHSHAGAAFMLPLVGLWDTVVIAPDGIQQKLSLDEGNTQPAGQILYKAEDIGLVLGGTMSLTAGPYAGLTGFYLQSLVPDGFSGNESYSIPNVATTTGEFSLAQDQSGNTSGTETFTVAMQSGYTQSEQIVISSDGSASFTGSDGAKITSTMSFTPSGAGTGTIKGSSPGLPATVVWDMSGTGVVTFANGSTESMTMWTMATS